MIRKRQSLLTRVGAVLIPALLLGLTLFPAAPAGAVPLCHPDITRADCDGADIDVVGSGSFTLKVWVDGQWLIQVPAPGDSTVTLYWSDYPSIDVCQQHTLYVEVWSSYKEGSDSATFGGAHCCPLSMTKTSVVSDDPLVPGSTITYTIVASNPASSGVSNTNIVISDTLPTGTSYVPGSSEVAVSNISHETVRDEFGGAPPSYSNNDGTVDWAGAWQEIGDEGQPDQGRIQIVSGQLRFQEADDNDGIERSADLADATSAHLSFDWYKEDCEEDISVFVSADGSSFDLLDTFTGTWTGGSESYDISAYASANMTVRFQNVVGNWTNENDVVFFDNVQIEFWKRETSSVPGSAPPDLVTAADGYDLLPGGTMTVTFQVTVNDPIPDGLTEVVNTACVTSDQVPDPMCDSTTDPIAEEPPHVEAEKTVDPGQICLDEEATITLVAVGAGDVISDRVPLDVVLVLDRSGSMEGQPFSDLKTAAKYFVDHLDPALDRVGLVSYSGSASLDKHLTADFAAVKSKIDGMSASGYTNIGQGVNYAQAELAANGRPDAEPVMIVFTDGVANRKTDGGSCETWPTAPTACTADAIYQAELAKTAGTTIFTIGLISGLQSQHPECLPLARQVLRTMASDPGKYYEAPASGDLEAIFAEIAYSVTNIAGRDVVITEVLPPYVHYVDGSADPPPTSIVLPTLTWEVGLLSIGERYTVTLRVTLDDIGLQQLVDVYPDSRVTYTDHEDQQVDVPFAETFIDVLAALLEFEKSGPSEVAAGETFAYLLTYENTGNDTADPVIITDVLPAAVDYVTSQPLGVEGPAGTIVWNLAPAPPGGPYTVVLTATVAPDVQPGQELVNTMQWGYGACWGWGAGQTTFTQTVRSAIIGDTVWEDTNGNGDQRDEAGTGIAGVTVDLHSGACDAGGEPMGAVVSSTLTSGSGFYSFTVAAGSGPYCIHIPDSEFESGGGLYGLAGSPQDGPGVPDDQDSDAHPTGHGITANAPASGSDLTFDFGFYWLGSLGDFVWWDKDYDGQQDGGEPGIPDVLVNLYDSQSQLVGSDTTDANGEYGFDNLPPDTYRIEIDASEFGPGGTLEDWVAGPQDVGPDATDSDGDPVSHAITTTLTAGEVDLSNDFGFNILSDYEISKRLNTTGTVYRNTPVSFTIRITNVGDSWISVLPMRDVYSTTYLTYGYTDTLSVASFADPDSDDHNNDGVINWSDLTVTLGDLAPAGQPGDSVTVVVTFTAKADTTLLPPDGKTINTAQVHDAWADPDGPGPQGPVIPLPEKEASDGVRIETPTAVEGVVLASLRATARPDGVWIGWETATEVQILGFNVLRRVSEVAFEQVNAEFIWAQYSGADQGAAYALRDEEVASGMTYEYELEVVPLEGDECRHRLGTVDVPWWSWLPLLAR